MLKLPTHFASRKSWIIAAGAVVASLLPYGSHPFLVQLAWCNSSDSSPIIGAGPDLDVMHAEHAFIDLIMEAHPHA